MRARRSLALGMLAFLGFASLGLPDGALGVAWPRVRESFGLPLDSLGALLAASVTGYASASFLAGAILARISLGALLALSCAATGAALLGYWAAPSWGAMVACGLVAGLGAGAIDAGINAFAALRFAPRTLHWLHAAYGLGTTAGPALMTHALMSGAGWRAGYLALGAAQLALALGFAATRRLWPGAPAADDAGGSGDAPAAPLVATLRSRAAQLGASSFFLYLGVEATAGAWLYSLLEEGRGASMAVASGAAGAYWGALLAGRVAFGFAPNRWGASAVVVPATLLCAVAAVGLALDAGFSLDLACAALLGFGAAPIFPALIASTPERIGEAHTANAVGLQIASAALGQAGLPALTGIAAARLGLACVPLALLGFALALLGVQLAARQLARRDARIAATSSLGTSGGAAASGAHASATARSVP
ncbi:MAG TPA: MFS transporter [Myxococcota bacterium]|nr:MFS transporter [Myxococcota bacterium]